jgi:leukotriene-A4 hydrolase
MEDPTTQSNYVEISTQHVAFDWHVDFKLKVITGSATHDLTVRKDGVEEVM